MEKLFVCYLGGKLVPGRIGEDHEVIIVVAEDLKDAKKKARLKWAGQPIDVHVDYITELDVVDGYKINVVKIDGDDSKITHYEDYQPLD